MRLLIGSTIWFVKFPIALWTTHCTVNLLFFSFHMRGQTSTLLCIVIIYRPLLSNTFHRNYHCLLGCKYHQRLYSMHPGEIAPSPLASLVSVVNKILISKVSSTPPPLVVDEIRNRSLVKL